MGFLDVVAVGLVAIAQVACFMIWSGHKTSVDELEEELAELEKERAKERAAFEDLVKVTTANAKTFDNFRAAVSTRLNLGPK